MVISLMGDPLEADSTDPLDTTPALMAMMLTNFVTPAFYWSIRESVAVLLCFNSDEDRHSIIQVPSLDSASVDLGPNVGIENSFNLQLEVVVQTSNILGGIVEKGNRVFNNSSKDHHE